MDLALNLNFEENDLIKHPAYKEKLVEMRKRFKELKAAAK